MRWARARKSVSFRSIILFLSTILPVFIMGVTAINIMERKLLETYETKFQKEVSAFFNTLEGELQEIKHQQDVMISDNDFLYLLNKDVFNFYVGNAVNSMGTKLSLMGSSTSYVEESDIYIRALNRRISTQDQRVKYLPPDFETMEGLLYGHMYLMPQQYRGELYVVTYPPFCDEDIDSLQYLIYTKISLDRIYENVSKSTYSESSVGCLSFDVHHLTYNPSGGQLFDKMLEADFSAKEEASYYQEENGRKYFVVGCYAPSLRVRYAQAVPVDELLSDVSTLNVWYWILLALLTLAVAIFTLGIRKTIKKPMDELLNGFMQVEQGNFSVQLPDRQNDDFSVSFRSFNHMAKELDRLINESYAGKILLQRAELRQLQAQINPHFLYNSFYILRNRIAENEREEALEFCGMLGQYFAYITRNQQDYTTLQQEYKHASIYAEIQAIRFRDRITLKVEELPERYASLQVPKLILQPILENAFQYGLEKMECDGFLHLSFETNGVYLGLVVEDNEENIEENRALEKIRQAMERKGILGEPSALYNIHRRIQILCGDECGLRVGKSEELGGLRFEVLLNTEKLTSVPKNTDLQERSKYDVQ